MKKLTVNKVAQLLQVSTQTIHMYEKFNIINIKRDGENNYRLYDREAIGLLLKSRLFQNLGFSMNEISNMFNISDETDIINSYQCKMDELENEIVRIKQKKLLLQSIIDSSLDCVHLTNKIEISYTPEFYYIPVFNHNESLYNLEKLEKSFLENTMNFRREYSIVKKEYLLTTKLKYEIVVGFDASIKDIYPSINEIGTYYPSQKAIVTYIRRENEHYNPLQVNLKNVYQYMKDYNLEINGDAIFESYLFIKRQCERICYMKVSIPIK